MKKALALLLLIFMISHSVAAEINKYSDYPALGRSLTHTASHENILSLLFPIPDCILYSLHKG
jgi:hypothetical protein